MVFNKSAIVLSSAAIVGAAAENTGFVTGKWHTENTLFSAPLQCEDLPAADREFCQRQDKDTRHYVARVVKNTESIKSKPEGTCEQPMVEVVIPAHLTKNKKAIVYTKVEAKKWTTRSDQDDEDKDVEVHVEVSNLHRETPLQLSWIAGPEGKDEGEKYVFDDEKKQYSKKPAKDLEGVDCPFFHTRWEALKTGERVLLSMEKSVAELFRLLDYFDPRINFFELQTYSCMTLRVLPLIGVTAT